MESFEQLCRVSLEADGFAVSGNVKFPVRKATRTGHQTHGYEVDLVGARGGKLVLAEVKSFLGSSGVNRNDFVGLSDNEGTKRQSLYKLLNDPEVRRGVVRKAREFYGYKAAEVEMRLYVGRFAGGTHERAIREHLGNFRRPRVTVLGVEEIVDAVMEQAKSKSYLDDPVLVTIKALDAASRLNSTNQAGKASAS